MISVVFYHQSIKHPLRRGLGEAGSAAEVARLLGLAVASVRHHMRDAEVVLITGDPAAIVSGVAVEHRPLLDPSELQIDRTRAYRDFVAARAGQAGGALFLDTDILVTGDAGRLFDEPFDAALTYLEASVDPPPTSVDGWGLPADGRLSAINFGVMAMRYTRAAASFLDAVLERFEAIAGAGGDFLTADRNVFSGPRGLYRIGNVRTWGGGQFAMTSLLSGHLFRKPVAERANVAGADVLLLPAARWNYTPPDDLHDADFSTPYIAHFKGAKKHWMPIVAQRLGYRLP